MTKEQEVANLARELLIWMVAGEAEVFSDARIASIVSTSFKIAQEWKDYKDALDYNDTEEAKENLSGNTKRGYGAI